MSLKVHIKLYFKKQRNTKMRCCVSFCVNNSEILPYSANVRFHRLPVEKLRRAAWIQALGIEDKYLQTVKGPSVCSLHFRAEDFHTTKSGLWVVKRCAIPKTEQVCIICLETDRRLFPLKYYNLEGPYETITGISLSKFSAILSPRVCWECGQRLLNCDAFRDRSVRANRILLKLSQEDELLKIQTIKKVNRKKHKLKSHLMKEIFKTNHSDYKLIHDEKSKSVKTESANKNVKVKIENIVYGSDAKTEVKNEAEKLTIAVEPKAEVVNTDLASDEEFLHDDMDNDGFLEGDIDKDIKNDGDILEKGTKTDNYKSVKLLNKDIKIDVEYSNRDNIDFEIDCADENEHNVNKSDCNVSLPDKNLDMDMDCQDENDRNVNSPHENDDIEMDVSDKNDSDVELVESTVKSDTKKKSAKTNVKLNKKATLSVNKCKINKRQSKITLNKPKVKLNEKDATTNNAVKVRKRVKKRKTESQTQGYLRRKPPTGGMELFKVTVLTYEEQVADLHSRKETALYKNSTFKCPYCFKGYQFEDPFDAHMQQHTDKYGQFECAVCGIRALSRQKLLHHLNMHVVKYSCTVCPFYTRHRNTAKSHGRAHKGTKTKCPHCDDVEFTNLNSLMSHVRKKHPSACVCPMCGFSFSGKMGLTLHLQRKHQVDSTQASQLDGPLCVECNIRFASEAAYEQHLAVSPTHNTDDNIQPNAPPRRRFKGLPRRRTAQTVTCEQCGAKLKGFKHYSIHFESQHRDLTRTQFANPHERRCLCEQCGRVFQNSSALKSHMLIHAGKKDIQCTICDKRFYYKRQLTLHMDIHNEPKRTFDCPVCARSFTCKSNKNRHLWTHTQVSRPFKCHACPKTFVYPSERKFHINHAHANQPYPKKPKNRVRNSRPKHVKEAPYGQIDPQSIINEGSYLSETSAILNE